MIYSFKSISHLLLTIGPLHKQPQKQFVLTQKHKDVEQSNADSVNLGDWQNRALGVPPREVSVAERPGSGHLFTLRTARIGDVKFAIIARDGIMRQLRGPTKTLSLNTGPSISQGSEMNMHNAVLSNSIFVTYSFLYLPAGLHTLSASFSRPFFVFTPRFRLPLTNDTQVLPRWISSAERKTRMTMSSV